MNTKKYPIWIRLLTSLTLFTVIVSATLVLPHLVAAQVTPAGPAGSVLGDIGKSTQLPDFSTKGHSSSSYEPGAANITSALYYVVDFIKYFMGTIAVAMIIISGVRLVTAGDKIEEIAPKMKENIKFAIIGLIVIMVSDVMIKQVFFGEAGEVFRSEADAKLAAERGTEQIRGIYNFIQIFVGAVAVLMIVIAGFRLVVQGSNEETMAKAKKQVMYAAIGIVVIGLSELVVKDIVFPEAGSKLSDVQRANELIINLTNFASSFIATIAVAMLMYGGVLYVTAAGDESKTEKAKKIFVQAVIGILIALAAFGIVNTVIQFQPGEGVATQESSSGLPPGFPTP